MIRLAAVLLSLLLLCSCSDLASGGGDLLVAPRLNTRQQEVYDALESVLNLSAIQYKYPQSGEYRSPFIFYDLDNDGKQEAVVFYAFRDTPGDTRARIMKEVDQGTWETLYDITGAGEQVDFIQFAYLLDTEQENMVIGWKNTHGASVLGVYSMEEGAIRPEIAESYDSYIMADFDGSGLSEIITVSGSGAGGSFQAYLFGRGLGGRLQNTDEFHLAENTTEILQLVTGTLWDGTGGLYIDEWCVDRNNAAETGAYTEILRVSGGRLEPVASQNIGEDFTSTFRQINEANRWQVLSLDLEENGRIRTPTLYPLAGQDYNEEWGMLMLTQYMDITADGFLAASHAVVNYDDGYRLRFPEKWLDTVTVLRQPEREWQFFALDEETGLPVTRLLSIRVYSVLDHQDQFASDYRLLASNGVLEYYVEIPRHADERLAVTEQEVQRMFALL